MTPSDANKKVLAVVGEVVGAIPLPFWVLLFALFHELLVHSFFESFSAPKAIRNVVASYAVLGSVLYPAVWATCLYFSRRAFNREAPFAGIVFSWLPVVFCGSVGLAYAYY
jgi:hypothetical protein